MNDKTPNVNEIVTAVGAAAEIAGLMREHLMTNGFTRKEAVTIAGQYICALCSTNNK